jgi:hypothetical protein
LWLVQKLSATGTRESCRSACHRHQPRPLPREPEETTLRRRNARSGSRGPRLLREIANAPLQHLHGFATNPLRQRAQVQPGDEAMKEGMRKEAWQRIRDDGFRDLEALLGRFWWEKRDHHGYRLFARQTVGEPSYHVRVLMIIFMLHAFASNYNRRLQ